MKMGDAFPGKTLKAEDLGANARIVVTIDHVTTETLGQGDDAEQKPVVYFKGKDKGLALNRTNFGAIVDITGQDDTDDWGGARILLYTTKLDFGGKRVLAIRVEDAPKGGPGRQTPTPPPEPEPDFTACDDDVPF